ncbi:hypothetical protein B0H16DRAFT_1527795 [Mycena metata]|uniref:F-box domain-containing protein n=1 Tax=Mycena metata TaxID=1033252 RepID=A0AAD7JEU4_9AGAR|nr:hypothetical protein B0H16DRAFT_1527795 [Mycena metata]
MAEPSLNSILGPDLILEFLDSLAVPLHEDQRFCDLSVLASCSAVCRTWSAHAQRLLFRRVILPNNIYQEPFRRGSTRNSLPSFLAAINPATERGRWLAESVISLTVRHTGRSRTSDSTALATALLRTPNLRHLDTTTICCHFDSETLTRLRESGPRITSLCILQDIALGPAQTYTRTMHQLVASFPSIRLLEITSDLNSSLPPFDPPPNLSLVCVKFNTTMVQDVGSCLASLMNPAAEEPLQVLRHKSVGSHPSQLGTVLRAHGAHLRSLAVKTLEPEQLAHLPLCPQLERFEIGRFPDAATFASIPRTITALAISGSPSALGTRGVDELAPELKTFPHLKVFTWSSCPQPMRFPMLERVCKTRGIEVRFSATATELTDNAIERELRRKYIRI